MKSIPKIANLLKVLDEVIMKQLIPSVTGGTECSDIEFWSLLLKMKGLEVS